MGDHDIIVNDVLPQPEVGSAGNPEEVVCENDIVTSGDDVFLEEIVFPCSLVDVSGEDDGGEQWIIFYSCEEEYKQVLENTGSSCDCLEESMLSEYIDVCSRGIFRQQFPRQTWAYPLLRLRGVRRWLSMSHLALSAMNVVKLSLILVEGMHQDQSLVTRKFTFGRRLSRMR